MDDIGKYHCPHCENTLSKKSYDAHKRLYYDEDAGQWIKRRRLTTNDEHTILSETENAIEQFDFDANLTDSIESPTDIEDELPPPYIDLGDIVEEVNTHRQGECNVIIIYCGSALNLYRPSL